MARPEVNNSTLSPEGVANSDGNNVSSRVCDGCKTFRVSRVGCRFQLTSNEVVFGVSEGPTVEMEEVLSSAYL